MQRIAIGKVAGCTRRIGASIPVAVARVSRTYSSTTRTVPTPLHTFTDEEQMLQDAGKSNFSRTPRSCPEIRLVRRFAKDVVEPKVREMDENEMMDPAIIQGLFEQGVRSLFDNYLGLDFDIVFFGPLVDGN
jgi:hypothetical protein